MRIITGRFRGHVLQAPKTQDTRPTTDANREALFNLLDHSLHHSYTRCLDLFAGTGALSFESLSRGAQSAVLIDQSRAALESIETNSRKLKLEPQELCTIQSSNPKDWSQLIQKKAPAFFPFDTIFCDPPYQKGLVELSICALEKNADTLYAPDALLIVETDNKETVNLSSTQWKCIKERAKGRTQLLFYKRA